MAGTVHSIDSSQTSSTFLDQLTPRDLEWRRGRGRQATREYLIKTSLPVTANLLFHPIKAKL